MIITVPKLLNAEQLQAINGLIDSGQFEDGQNTAGWHAKTVKQNRQWLGSEEQQAELDHCLTVALSQQQQFTASSYPKYIQPFMVSESCEGGHYGPHIDDALMGQEAIARSDLSCTIFLSDPAQYQGGELRMDYQNQSLEFKLSAGDAIVYPSTTLHEVTPVSQGVRRVALTWIESYVRHASQREILYDLDTARKDIMNQHGKTDAFDRITKSHANLLRQWADT
ncbi:Fe2+-dependent dioxygenase [Pseudoteredinibacter isoporae]|uniref:PKHD-type hydroxylase n=1 Tax=Pseudoteredinibacter isoporae TaxID=570281 RepID=A0A7X0JWL5_9GAMM|nr:Fe2+-dependent dioxygenase [Pseudoteredinibacter isoporae]MBB6523580.1 PKHD-type hydroxylase [Pseudoteredinibacter isoporae]NHO89088.1 Fe2+-dependent dioxygenase [Pseudoteredinibacter isoporae]NIB22301.1 Fe2+-dependent dioxygenase [Pseudoteredinibacter isoporae]